jgi:formate/nitrite transporter FocA (FNT family)
MLMLTIACLAGIFLGLKYNFLVLIPVTIVTGSICWASSLMSGVTLSATLIDVIIPGASLQAGYMLGLTSRDFVNQVWSTVVSSSGNEYR